MLKRFLFGLFVVIALTLPGCVGGVVMPASAVRQMIGRSVPSSTPTTTHTTLAAATRTSTPNPTQTSTPTATPTNPPTRAPTILGSRTPIARVARVPILMYHYVSVPPPDADKYRLDLSVTPANFEAQVEYLAIEGYRSIRLSDLADHLLNGTPLPPKPIILTFDDGYSDMYQNVLPILKNYGFTATFFIVTDFIDNKNPAYLTWDQVKELANAGMEIGSHTLNHPDLSGKSRAFQSNQILGSKTIIESRLGIPVKSFSYPSTQYDSTTLDLLRSAGYLVAVTENQGLVQSSAQIYELKRVRVRGSFSVADFATTLKYFAAIGR